ncbi:hypothetical protein [Streptomyces sp. NPDC060001]|uniref:hypothetical protein n=1 Tax=Streptomyces sp. NPDC060001 TaxID=3347032 RepID=UPI00367FFAEB
MTALNDFQAIHTSDLDDYDIAQHLRCRRCGLFLTAPPEATLADLTEHATSHHCLTERPTA